MEQSDRDLRHWLKLNLTEHLYKNPLIIEEWSIGESRADLVCVTDDRIEIFEIKSDYDTLQRLDKQISDYYKVTPFVTVVTGKKFKNLKTNFLSIGHWSGCSMSNSQSNPMHLSLDTIYSTIRRSEAKKILKHFNIDIPVLPNTKIYEGLRKLFVELDALKVTKILPKVIKESRFKRVKK